MRYTQLVLAVLTSILINTLPALANDPLPCPSIELAEAPEGAARRISAFVFDNIGKQPLVYNWTVSAGEILSGQGTKSIVLSFKDEEPTITVEVTGDVPPECPNTKSITLW